MNHYLNSCIHPLFEEQVSKTPDKIALVMGEQKLTYSCVNQQANQIAHALISLGVSLENPVGICLRRSPLAVIGILGILKAGGAYVPVDPDFPETRKQDMIEDAGCQVLITETSLVNLFPNFQGKILRVDDKSLSEQNDKNPKIVVSPDSLMYILYTSGSTGKPKGVCGIHRATVNRFVWMWHQYPFTDDEVCCHKTTLNFVDSVWEIFGPLIQGIKVVIFPQSAIFNPQELVELLHRSGVTRIVVVPSLLQALLNTFPNLRETLPCLKIWIVSGEKLSRNLLEKFTRKMPDRILLNLYGSTEVAGDVTWAEFPRDLDNLEPDVPIGKPILNAEVYVLDEQLQPVSSGEIGELWVGGSVLARGYHNQPAETKARFIPHPFSAQGMLFKTGDLVIKNDQGIFYYIGRIDHQVKIRGIRVELEEIEKVLSQFDVNVSNVTVVVQEQGETQQLVAFVTPLTVNVHRMKEYAVSQLPNYMVPGKIIALDELPLTPNGKVDRQSLSRMTQWTFREMNSDNLPQTQAEKLMAEIWQQMFMIFPIYRDDQFFDLGGDSLSALSFLEQLEQKFGRRISLTEFANDSSLATLANFEETRNIISDYSDFELLLSDIKIIPFELQYLEQTIQLVTDAFTQKSPLELALTIQPKEFNLFAHQVCQKSLLENLSYIAIKPTSSQVIAFCLCGDYHHTLNSELDIPEFLTPVFSLLDSLDQKYVENYGEVKPGEIFHIFMSGSSVEAESLSLTLALEKKVLEIAKSLNYKRAVTTCTHAVTNQIAQELNYQKKYAIQYDSFEFEGRRIFASVSAFHREAALFEKIL